MVKVGDRVLIKTEYAQNFGILEGTYNVFYIDNDNTIFVICGAHIREYDNLSEDQYMIFLEDEVIKV